ncbi:MAG: response regulator [Acidobacteriota bacterium]
MGGANPQLSPDPTFRAARLAVVEMSPDVREVLLELISGEALVAEIEELPPESMERRIKSHPSIDVLLIDLQPPAARYLAFLPEIRERSPGTRVIFISAMEDIHLWAEAIQLGAYDFLPKPIDPVEFCWVLQGAIQQPSDIRKPAASSLRRRSKEALGG